MDEVLSPAVPLSKRIREVRHELQLTQQDVAHLSNIDISNYGRIERGKTNPNLETLTRIANALNTTVSDLTKYITSEYTSPKDRRITARHLIEAIEKQQALKNKN
ncbi:helix-turn-helix transcriptional regulator [Canibacter sp. lx-72]|uniref:helix-turn-helix domain-containing protein n=1 Tax=Canibacter zhuwentaonis TaxID=2837491 RepID=UPI001BDCFCA1|nr:helix-turn-helix transcriptional regulator [Canibacter zhuwentaonis]MBT1018088.1 helix-turn-helix transcriptional regulator [Canibacter zhuwentaonis]MBT1035376.1 helix-turn-helix transcriptional regulator [Canibacter zhuwentaonis]